MSNVPNYCKLNMATKMVLFYNKNLKFVSKVLCYCTMSSVPNYCKFNMATKIAQK